MLILVVTYKGTFLVFHISQEDLVGTLEDIRNEPIVSSCNKMIKELDYIECEIFNYKLSCGNKNQEVMLNDISNKIMKSYKVYPHNCINLDTVGKRIILAIN